LVVAPVPAVDLAVGFVGDLCDYWLSVAGDGGDAVADPLVFDGLTTGAEAADALPCGVIAVADGQRGCGCALRLAFLADAAVTVVAVTDAAVVVIG